MYILKTNTAVRISVGPLVDPTDGKTAETALTVTGLSMQLYQIKNDGSAVVRTQVTPTASSGDNDMALVTSSTDGMYDLEITAAQLNWLGNGRITFYDVDGFLVHWIDIQVVSAAYFNWIYGTTIPNVNTTQISGDGTAADNAEAFFDGTGYAGTNNVIPTVTNVTNAVKISAGTGAGQLDFTSGVVKANLAQILGTALTETSGQIAAAFKKFFDKATPTGTINSLPDAVAGANGGLPTTNGTKVSQTVDLTAAQSIACSDKTGFALSATGADLILKSSTFIQAIVAAINELATYGLTALNTLLVTTGIKTATTAAPTDMAKESTLAAMTTAISGGAAAVWNYLTTALTTAGSIGKWFADWFAETPAGATSLGASDLVLVNNALTLLGHDTLSNLTGTDKVTTLCLQFYQRTVDNVLRAYTWNCAMTRSAALTAGTTPAFGYAYSFTLPSGCLRVIRMSEKEYVFKVEGAYLLTDESSAQILYIARIAPTAMDTLLIEAISARLASLLAFPLTNSNKVAEDMWKMYLAKLDEAQNIDAFEGTADSLEADDWINKRA